MSEENGSVPSPWPPRRYGWVVEMQGGSRIREFVAEPPARRWDDLNHDRIEQIELRDLWPSGEEGPILHVDLRDASLEVRGSRVEVLAGEQALTGVEGDVQPVQRKRAQATFRPGRGQTRSITAYELGFQRDIASHPVELVAQLRTSDASVGMTVTLPEETELDNHDVDVHVDGDKITQDAAFQAAVAPGG